MKVTYIPPSKALIFSCFFSLFFLFSFHAFAQVGIGTTTPNANALLEIDASTTAGGLLMPRVALTSTTSPAPLSADVAGMTVYNTATSGTPPNNVTPGYYYNNGTIWVRIADATTAGNNWSLDGNAGTVPGTNYLGTIDDVSLELFTFNTTRMRLENDGQVSIGFGADPVYAGQQFNVGSTYVNGDAIAGYSGGTGSGVYGQNIADGYGVYGLNNDTGIGVYGVNIGFGPGVRGESFFGYGLSILGLDGTILSDNTLFGADAVVGYTDNMISFGLWAVNFDPDGTAILGGNDNLSIFPSIGAGVSGSGTQLGINGYAGEGDVAVANEGNAAGRFVLDMDSDPSTNGANNGYRAHAILASFDNVDPNGTSGAGNSYFGGYFSGGRINGGSLDPSYAYAGIKYNTANNGTGGTNYKIIGNGTNSTIIKDADGTPRIMFSPEAPEILFQDFGTGKLSNGVARITLDPILKNAIFVDNNHPLKVFVTLEGECNGVYVTDKSDNGFTVKELNGGNSNVSFSWQIVANRKDDIAANGTISSKHVGLRFPVGPGPLKPISSISKKDNKKYIVDRNRDKSTVKVKEEKVSEEQAKQIITPLYNSGKMRSKMQNSQVKAEND